MKMGIGIGWPNSTSGGVTPQLTAVIQNSPDLTLNGNYTIMWWGGAINPNPVDVETVFFSCGTDLRTHSAYLLNAGSVVSPNYIFKYYINDILCAEAPVPGVISQRWNFYCIERNGDRIYFSFNGQWVSTFNFNPDPVSNFDNPLFIGSRDIGGILLGEITNFEWSNSARFAVSSNFPVPTENFVPDADTILLVGQGLSFSQLKTDLSGNGNNVTTGNYCSYVEDDPFGDGSTGSFLFQ
jgi:hypothetical protein